MGSTADQQKISEIKAITTDTIQNEAQRIKTEKRNTASVTFGTIISLTCMKLESHEGWEVWEGTLKII